MKETLENNGVLGEIKARVRAEVFHALDDPNQRKPQLSNENMLINELIREYLEFNRYKYTSSVLLAGKLVSRPRSSKNITRYKTFNYPRHSRTIEAYSEHDCSTVMFGS